MKIHFSALAWSSFNKVVTMNQTEYNEDIIQLLTFMEVNTGLY